MHLRPLPPVLAIAAVLLLTACGGGDGGGGVASLGDGDGEEAATDTTLSEEEAQEALIDWAECMRGQGFDVPDPQIGEDGEVAIRVGGGAGGPGDGGDAGDGGGPPPDRGAFEAAREECGDPPQIGGEFSEEDREEMQARALAFAECMRENGIEDFPDPDFSRSGPGAGPRTRATEADGAAGPGRVIAGPFGEVDLSDPAEEAAFEACQDELGDRMGGPPREATEG